MLFSLSTSVIIDTIQATAAFRILSAPTECKSTLAPLLRPETRGQIKLMVKNAFAEVILALLPHVGECSLDNETALDNPGHQDTSDDSDMLLTVELTPVSQGRDYAGASVRRTLERIVALKAMQLWSISAADHVSAEAYEALASSSLATLLTSLVPVPRPFLR